MKKAIAKQLRELANSLPPLYMDRVMGTKVTGAELLKSSQEGLPKDIEPEAIYKQKYIARVPMNHYNNLKKGYKLMGPSVIPQYVQAVKSVVEQLAKEQTELSNNQNPQDVDGTEP